MKDTVAIIGSHPRTRGEVDLSRQDIDVWVFNEAVKTETNSGWASRADVVFQLHDPVIWRNPNNRNDPNHYAWLQRTDIPKIIMQKRFDDVPNSVQLPKDEILTIFRDFQPYVTSSIAWAILYAVHCGYKKLIIRGVELETETEYVYQQPAFAMAVGIALGAGVDVDCNAEMFNFPLYGFEGDVRLERDLFSVRFAELQAQVAANADILKHNTEQFNKLLRHFADTGEGEKEFAEFLKGHIAEAVKVENLHGAAQENDRYLKKADAMIAVSGDFIFSRQEFEGAMQGAAKRHQEYINMANQIGGKLQEKMSEIAKTQNKIKRQKKMGQAAPILNEYIKANLYSGIFYGCMMENKCILGILDKKIKAAGGSKSEAVMLKLAQKGIPNEKSGS